MLAGFAQSLAMVPMSVILLRTAEDRFAAASWACACSRSTRLPIGLLAAGALIQYLGYVTDRRALLRHRRISCALLIALRWRDQLWQEEGTGAR